MTRRMLYWITPLALTVAACDFDGGLDNDGEFETTTTIDRPGEPADIGDGLGQPDAIDRTASGARDAVDRTASGARDAIDRTTAAARRATGADTRTGQAGQPTDAARTQLPGGEYRLAAGEEPMAGKQAEPKEAFALLMPLGSNQAVGGVEFKLEGEQLKITGEIRGLSPGKHGLHVHEFGDLSDMQGGESAGDHFAPEGMQHGRPEDQQRHVGDLGNIEANEQGVAYIDITDSKMKLSGPHSVIGRALIVHQGEDKFTQPTGDAGGRVAAGIIGIGNPQAEPTGLGQRKPMTPGQTGRQPGQTGQRPGESGQQSDQPGQSGEQEPETP